MSEEYPYLTSLTDVPLDVLQGSLKRWLLKKGLALSYKTSHPDRKKETYGDNPILHFLTNAYQYFEGNDGTSFSKDHDIWQLNSLPFPVNVSPVNGPKSLNFSKIAQSSLKEQIKEAVYYRLKRASSATVSAELYAIRKLCEFLHTSHEDFTDFTQFNRALLEEYLSYLYLEAGRKKNYTSELSHLKTALETLGKLYECEHLKALFLPTDFSKKKLPVFTFYSDAELSRLHEAYRFLDKQTARILLLHELLGLRISDTLTLKVTDIVMEPKPHLKILQQKTGNYLKKSINNDILLLLNASIKETYETYGEQEYIFVCDKDPKSPLPYKTVYYRLQVLINTHDLKDDHGNPLTAGTHIFRRTYGKKLCDLNLDDVTISSVIGHHGTGSVADYRRMSSKVLAANTKTVIDKRNDKIHKYRKGWMK